jgi:hypothetical protein
MATAALTLANAERRGPSPLGAWLATWVVVPNLIFMLLWMLGAPSRYGVIALTVVVGLVARRWRYAYRATALIAIMLFGAVSYIATIFNLNIETLLLWLPALPDLHPERSTTYVIAGIAIIINMGVGLLVARQDGRFSGRNSTFAVAAIVAALLMSDQIVSRATSSSYGRMPMASMPFTSSVIRSGFVAKATPGRHLMLVLVESFGIPRDPVLFANITRALDAPEMRRRYTMTSGTTPYYGATING